jgi:hypothetical protein
MAVGEEGSMSKKRPIPATRDGYRKELMDLLRKNAYRHDLHSVWSDFVEMGALAYANAVDLAQREAREERYMQIVKKYNADELSRMAQALGALTLALEAAQFDDVLGATFMELELGNKWAGQFFTPYCISYMMAQFHVDDRMREIVKRHGFVTASDPCVGGGAMPIALAHAMFDAGMNPQQHLHVTVQDVDIKAVHMAYLQLSMLHIPAIVIHGNTLANEQRSLWYTPAHILNGWSFRLDKREEPSDNVEEFPPIAPIQLTQQISLFEEAA